MLQVITISVILAITVVIIAIKLQLSALISRVETVLDQNKNDSKSICISDTSESHDNDKLTADKSVINESLIDRSAEDESTLDEWNTAEHRTDEWLNNTSPNKFINDQSDEEISLTDTTTTDTQLNGGVSVDKFVNDKLVKESADDKLLYETLSVDKLINNISAEHKHLLTKYSVTNYEPFNMNSTKSWSETGIKTKELERSEVKESMESLSEPNNSLSKLLHGDLVSLAEQECLTDTIEEIMDALQLMTEYSSKFTAEQVSAMLEKHVRPRSLVRINSVVFPKSSDTSLENNSLIKSVSSVIVGESKSDKSSEKQISVKPSISLASFLSQNGSISSYNSTLSAFTVDNSLIGYSARGKTKSILNRIPKKVIRMKYRNPRFNGRSLDASIKSQKRSIAKRVYKLKKKLELKKKECEERKETLYQLKKKLKWFERSTLPTYDQCDHLRKWTSCNVLISYQKSKMKELENLLQKKNKKLEEIGSKYTFLNAANKGREIAIKHYKECLKQKFADIAMFKEKEQALNKLCQSLTADCKAKKAQMDVLKGKINKLMGVITSTEDNFKKQLQIFAEENERLRLFQQDFTGSSQCLELSVENRISKLKLHYTENIEKATEKLIKADNKIKELFSVIELFLRKVHFLLYGGCIVEQAKQIPDDELSVFIRSVLKMDDEEISKTLNNMEIPKVDDWIRICSSLAYKEKFAQEVSSFMLSVMKIPITSVTDVKTEGKGLVNIK
ncbi:hypothetical protein O3M35_008575 [Rhynocoris fuscipes]|uniref:Uncharacterized protein n=1 Tax=Rhynocoris fuscipes TaxID=488301 RepID=A0AAW1D9G7_9HEMI